MQVITALLVCGGDRRGLLEDEAGALRSAGLFGGRRLLVALHKPRCPGRSRACSSQRAADVCLPRFWVILGERRSAGGRLVVVAAVREREDTPHVSVKLRVPVRTQQQSPWCWP